MFDKSKSPTTDLNADLSLGTEPFGLDEGGLIPLSRATTKQRDTTSLLFLPRVPIADQAVALVRRLADACDVAAKTGATASIDLAYLDWQSRRQIDSLMGEGEISCIVAGQPVIRAQEAVFAGLWRITGGGIDRIEVAPVPRALAARAFAPASPPATTTAAKRPGVTAAPAIVAELIDRSAAWRDGDPTHVITLSDLSNDAEDLACLDTALGIGSAKIRSRGYGDCRIMATGLANVWRVQFFNETEMLILDTFEVTAVPEVAMATADDFDDSAHALREWLGALS
ncbi:MAG: hydrogenase expression/formation protein [Pseudomonadota bacterium]